jgi:RNA polymerase sigma-70 factor (ECF subfamily)
VYEACKLQGWSYDRVAAKMGCTLNTVHEHIILANKFVREYIQKHGDMFLVILTVVLGCK